MKLHKVDVSYSTVGDRESAGKSLAVVPVHSTFEFKQQCEVYALVVRAITGQLPPISFQIDKESPIKNLELADPAFNVPSEIDLLLGTGVFADIVQEGLIKHGKMIAQKTKLGWIVSGTQSNLSQVANSRFQSLHCKVNIQEQLKAFWELEEIVGEERRLSVEEQICESHFESTHKKLMDGRFDKNVAKMYRQIWVAESHRDFQRIVWRKNPSGPIKDYRLCTVTYGTSFATYVALKVVEVIVQEAKEYLPLAAEIASKFMYMDNIFAGAHDLSAALVVKEQLGKLFEMAKFELRKWASNSTQFMDTIPSNLCETPIEFNGKSFIKTLGSYWDPNEDQFRYRIRLGELPMKLTKRKMLSEASGLFDPLGLVSPSIVIAKIQLQELWKVDLDWDDTLPEYLSRKYLELREDLPRLENIKIPRWTGNCETEILTELHGFADASNKAYAAAIVVRVLRLDGSVLVTLLASKTKVAPIKPHTIDRLELCGAILLSRLLKRVQKTMEYEVSKSFAWSDNMTVLYWLQSDPSRWKAFVANRTAEILSNLPEVR